MGFPLARVEGTLRNQKTLRCKMKVITILSVLVASGIAFQTAALAQGRVYAYCLESGDAGGGSTVNCAYESFDQCRASKGSPSDTCYANPQGGGR
jgi:hypothetical protein